MRKYAQIYNNKAHWIFEAETMPEFASNIVLKDVTDLNPQPQEGWNYDSATDTFSSPPPPPVPTLSEVQTNKIQEINNKYNQALAQGFTSSASGSAIKYGYGDSEQKTFDDLSTADLRGWITYPFDVYDQNGNPISLTDQTQLHQLFQDIFNFKYPLKTKQHDYISQVNECTTIDDVNKIVVTF